MRETYSNATDGMPASCATLNEKCGGDACARCPVAKLGKNPLLIASEVRKRKALPPPQLDPIVAQPVVIVEPPFPYTRTTAGIRQKTKTKDKEGVEIEEDVVICPYDLFPVEMCGRTELDRAFSLWVVKLPKEKQKTIKLTTTTVADLKAFFTEMSD